MVKNLMLICLKQTATLMTSSKKDFNYDHFPDGLKDESYNPDKDIMNEARNLFTTGIS